MTDYENNIKDFYNRDDFAAIAGRQGAEQHEVLFQRLEYTPRKAGVLPGILAGHVLKEYAAAGGAATLYLHIPFCNLRCSYCSFYRNPFEVAQVEAYVQLLIKELDLLAQQGVFDKHPIEAVFFGGGTPSVLGAAQIERLLTKIHALAKLVPDCELTFESSIYDLDADKLAACIAGGINRFSFGVQSFDTKLRRSLGRINTEQEVMAKLEEAGKTGARVIIDLIYGLIGQTQEMLLADVERAVSCGVSGLDLYKLQIMPKSPLGQAIESCKINYDHSDAALGAMFGAAAARLALHGAKPLSCCHWAMRADERSRYNTLVKRGTDVIACGCGCGGHMGLYKFMKTMDIAGYQKKLEQGQYPVMTVSQYNANSHFLWQLSGQCDAGCLDFAALRSYNDADWSLLLAQLLQHWQSLGLLTEQNFCYYLTTKGKYYYRQLDRLLLTAAEYALYGKPGLLEQAGQKMLGMMKNMQ